MKRRAVQILLALLVIIYRKTWFWWIFNHFAGRLVPASREFFSNPCFFRVYRYSSSYSLFTSIPKVEKFLS